MSLPYWATSPHWPPSLTWSPWVESAFAFYQHPQQSFLEQQQVRIRDMVRCCWQVALGQVPSPPTSGAAPQCGRVGRLPSVKNKQLCQEGLQNPWLLWLQLLLPIPLPLVPSEAGPPFPPCGPCPACSGCSQWPLTPPYLVAFLHPQDALCFLLLLSMPPLYLEFKESLASPACRACPLWGSATSRRFSPEKPILPPLLQHTQHAHPWSDRCS